ncbi:MAG: ribosome maturation factor RimM [Proteobacteria bacterium]|nr:ribosome maturation factor RimM [Pseudomonadota bacterium]MDA1131941.1 ribosome maturation factor RimM [Pseudomonadota bacterium]
MGGGNRICLGEIAGPHGLGGSVRVRSFAATPEDLGAYGPLTDKGGRTLRILSLRRAGDGLLVRFDGIGDRSAAEALRGARLFVDRDRLPPPQPDEYYHADLIGLAVERTTGEPLGAVAAVRNYGAGDLLEVALPGGGSELIPFADEFVPVVDIAAGRVVADPPRLVDAADPDLAAEEAADHG